MKRFGIFIVFLVCIVLQIQLARIFSFLRTVPIQFLLVTTVFYSMDRDWFGGMLVGISAGVMLDLFSGGPLGAFMLSYGLIGFLIGYFQALVFKEEFVTKVVIVFLATLVLQVVNFQIIRNFQPNMEFMVYAYRSILPGAFLNCAAAIPLLIYLQKKPKGRRSWSRGRRRV